MPSRHIPIVTEETYHVFNRSIARQPIFFSSRDYQRFLDLIEFYSFQKPSLRFSHYNRLNKIQKKEFIKRLKINNKKQIQILAFCLMPNHLHFLLKELEPSGITNFMKNIQNSYAKFFNTKHKRTGSLFQSMFKAVRIETDEQLLHVCRYIHLNPVTSYIIKDVEDLKKFKWSSFLTYIGTENLEFIDKKEILSFFRSIEDFIKFTFDQTDYQRELDKIKHLISE